MPFLESHVTSCNLLTEYCNIITISLSLSLSFALRTRSKIVVNIFLNQRWFSMAARKLLSNRDGCEISRMSSLVWAWKNVTWLQYFILGWPTRTRAPISLDNWWELGEVHMQSGHVWIHATIMNFMIHHWSPCPESWHSFSTKLKLNFITKQCYPKKYLWKFIYHLPRIVCL